MHNLTILYPSTFVLAWIILPIQMEYHSSGHFSFKEKLKDSLRKLLFAGLAALAAGVVYLVFMVSSGGGSVTKVAGFTMAMSNTYGVLLITVLMGSGLVGVPKRLWLMADTQLEMQRLYLSVTTSFPSCSTSFPSCSTSFPSCSTSFTSCSTSFLNIFICYLEYI
jgi:hypothetical protein